jgi:hypothetical protein
VAAARPRDLSPIRGLAPGPTWLARALTLVAHLSATEPGHNTNGIGCSCEGFDRRGVCTHQMAVASIHQRAEAARIAAAQPVRESAQQLFAEAGPFGPRISKQGCTDPAGGKSRLCGRHLDALLDQFGA